MPVARAHRPLRSLAWRVAGALPDAGEIGRALPAVLASLALSRVFLPSARLIEHREPEMLLGSP